MTCICAIQTAAHHITLISTKLAPLQRVPSRRSSWNIKKDQRQLLHKLFPVKLKRLLPLPAFFTDPDYKAVHRVHTVLHQHQSGSLRTSKESPNTTCRFWFTWGHNAAFWSESFSLDFTSYWVIASISAWYKTLIQLCCFLLQYALTALSKNRYCLLILTWTNLNKKTVPTFLNVTVRIIIKVWLTLFELGCLFFYFLWESSTSWMSVVFAA